MGSKANLNNNSPICREDSADPWPLSFIESFSLYFTYWNYLNSDLKDTY